MTWFDRFLRKGDRPEPNPGEFRAQRELLASERSVQRSRLEGEEGRAIAERLKEIRMRNHLAEGLRIRLQEALRD
jgi:hypothetical protein